jgi:hypothetical protein
LLQPLTRPVMRALEADAADVFDYLGLAQGEVTVEG